MGVESGWKRTPGGVRDVAEPGASATPIPAPTSTSIVDSSLVSWAMRGEKPASWQTAIT